MEYGTINNMKPETLRKLITYALGITLFLPLMFTGFTMFPANFGKISIFQILISILLFGGVYYVLFYKKEIVKFKTIDWVLLIFLGFSFVSAILGTNWNRSFWGDQSRMQGLFHWIYMVSFYFLIRQFFYKSLHWKKVIYVIVGVGALSSIIAWLALVSPYLQTIVPPGRISGIIGNPIFFANYLMLPIFLSFFGYFYYKKDNKKNNWIWLVGGLISLFTFLGTETRGPFVGLVAAILFGIFLYLIFSRNKKIKLLITSIFIVLLVVVGSGFIFDSVRNLFPHSSQFIFSINPNAVTAQTRIMAWDIAYKSWLEKPIFGHGPESFQEIFDRNYNPEFLSFSFAETIWDQPHNYVLEMLSSRGIVGLGLYVSIIILTLILLIRLIRREDNSSKKIAIIFLASGFVGYIVQLMFSFETSNSWQLWFVFIAFILWLESSSKNEEGSKIDVSRVFSYFIILLVSFGVVFSVYHNYKLISSSYFTTTAYTNAVLKNKEEWVNYAQKTISYEVPILWEQAVFLSRNMSDLDARGALNKEMVSRVAPQIVIALEDSNKNYPNVYLYNLWLGHMYTFMGEYLDSTYYELAEERLFDAWAVNKDRQIVPMLIGKLYFLQGKVDESIKILQELVDKDPKYQEPHWLLGLTLVSADRPEEGIIELEKGQGWALTTAQNFIYLIDVYANLEQYDKIPSLYLSLITIEPNNAEYYARLAAAYVAVEDKEKALNAIDRAVALDPSLIEEAKLFIQQNNLIEK
jgi:O-antigen ligase/tetratricopeptide (TPR) repeat protein